MLAFHMKLQSFFLSALVSFAPYTIQNYNMVTTTSETHFWDAFKLLQSKRKGYQLYVDRVLDWTIFNVPGKRNSLQDSSGRAKGTSYSTKQASGRWQICGSKVVSSVVFQNGWKPLYAPNKSRLDLQQRVFAVQIVEEGSWENNRQFFSIQIRLSEDKSYIHLGRCTCRISHRGKAQWGSRAKDHDTNRATWSTSKVPYTLYPL